MFISYSPLVIDFLLFIFIFIYLHLYFYLFIPRLEVKINLQNKNVYFLQLKFN